MTRVPQRLIIVVAVSAAILAVGGIVVALLLRGVQVSAPSIVALLGFLGILVNLLANTAQLMRLTGLLNGHLAAHMDQGRQRASSSKEAPPGPR